MRRKVLKIYFAFSISLFLLAMFVEEELLTIIWITIMSFKIPLDAFSNNPLNVIFGPKTNSKVGGISIIDFVFVILYFFTLFKIAKIWLSKKLNNFVIFKLSKSYCFQILLRDIFYKPIFRNKKSTFFGFQKVKHLFHF